MWHNKKLLFALDLLIVAAIGLSACQAAPAADAEKVAQLEADLAAAKAAGASGAKLVGGGRGGNMIALVDESNRKTVEQALIDAGTQGIIITNVE